MTKLKKIVKKARKRAKKASKRISKAYGAAKPIVNKTYKGVKNDLGIKKSKKKTRLATPQEFSRSFMG